MFEVGSPREFGVEGDSEKFDLVSGFDDRVVKTEGNVSGVGEFSRENGNLGFFRSKGKAKRVEVDRD